MISELSLWPYDEVDLSYGQARHEFQLKAPWVVLKIRAAETEESRLGELAKKFQSRSLGPIDRGEMTWLLGSLSQFPIAYYLPRTVSEIPGEDLHEVMDPLLCEVSPVGFFRKTIPKFLDTSKTLEFDEWLWPHDEVLAFSKINSEDPSCAVNPLTRLYDPYSLFSVARRFSLVAAAQQSESGVLFKGVGKLSHDREKYREACAHIVRQNHYVTEQCNSSLLPALDRAQGAKEMVNRFIRSEFGHDRLLLRAVQSLGYQPEDLKVVPAAMGLMALLKLSATSNFLAFALAVDIFERTSYGERDPLAQLLDSAGLNSAAKQIDIHKGINDSGAHENVALSFLSQMAPVSEIYAREALCFAEMISFMVQQVSREVAAIAILAETHTPTTPI